MFHRHETNVVPFIADSTRFTRQRERETAIVLQKVNNDSPRKPRYQELIQTRYETWYISTGFFPFHPICQARNQEAVDAQRPSAPFAGHNSVIHTIVVILAGCVCCL